MARAFYPPPHAQPLSPPPPALPTVKSFICYPSPLLTLLPQLSDLWDETHDEEEEEQTAEHINALIKALKESLAYAILSKTSTAALTVSPPLVANNAAYSSHSPGSYSPPTSYPPTPQALSRSGSAVQHYPSIQLGVLSTSSVPRIPAETLIQVNNLLLICYVESLARVRTSPHEDKELQAALAAAASEAASPHASATTASPPPPLSSFTVSFLSLLSRNLHLCTTTPFHSLLDYFVSQYGLLYLLQAAHQQKSMETAMEFIAVSAAHHLSPRALSFLVTEEYTGWIMSSAAGSHCFRCLSPSTQLNLVLVELMPAVQASTQQQHRLKQQQRNSNTNATTTVALLALVYALIPRLDPHDLFRLCTFTDPLSKTLAPSTLDTHSRILLVEVFIVAMLRLRWIGDHTGFHHQQQQQNTHSTTHHDTHTLTASRSAAAEEEEDDHASAAVSASEDDAEDDEQSAADDSRRDDDSRGDLTSTSTDSAEELNFYSLETLSSTLCNRRGEYRMWIILSACFDYHQYLAIAILYEQCGQYADAMEARLHHLQQQRDEDSDNEDDELLTKQALDLLSTHLIHIPTGAEQARLLLLWLYHWFTYELPTEMMENTLIEMIPSLADSLCCVLFASPQQRADAIASTRATTTTTTSTTTTTPNSSVLPVSAALYLHLTSYRLQLLHKHQASALSATHAATPRVWSEILSNMFDTGEASHADHQHPQPQSTHRDASSSTHHHAHHHPPPPPTHTTQSTQYQHAYVQVKEVLSLRQDGTGDHAMDAAAVHSDLIAFSCHHCYYADDLYDRVLPAFTARLAQLSPAIPITSAFFAAEYHKSVIRLACPVCVYNCVLLEKAKLAKNVELATSESERAAGGNVGKDSSREHDANHSRIRATLSPSSLDNVLIPSSPTLSPGSGSSAARNGGNRSPSPAVAMPTSSRASRETRRQM